MISNTNQSAPYIKTLQTLHLAMIGGQVAFYGVSLFIVNSPTGGPLAVEFQKIFMMIVPVFLILGLAGGHLIFRFKLQQAKQETSLVDKLNSYRIALIIALAILEAPSVLAGIAFLVTGSYAFLIMGCIAVTVFMLLRPSKSKIISDIELNQDESIALDTFEIKR